MAVDAFTAVASAGHRTNDQWRGALLVKKNRRTVNLIGMKLGQTVVFKTNAFKASGFRCLMLGLQGQINMVCFALTNISHAAVVPVVRE